MARTRIKLASINIDKLNSIVGAIKDISTRNGVMIKGPVPLPTKN